MNPALWATENRRSVDSRRSTEMRSDINSLHLLLSRALVEISKQASGKKLAVLKTACTDCLAELEKSSKVPSSASSATSSSPESIDAIFAESLRLFHPLQLACESKQPRIVQIALDAIQKMMTYGFVRGGFLAEPNSSLTFVDKVINVICDCYDNPDENVQLQILKALLSSVTSPVFEIHDTTLMRALRTCRFICLMSKNAPNQKTAKATLTQMINAVFSKMEKNTKEPNSSSASPTNTAAPKAHVEVIDESKQETDATVAPVPAPAGESALQSELTNQKASPAEHENIAEANESKTSTELKEDAVATESAVSTTDAKTEEPQSETIKGDATENQNHAHAQNDSVEPVMATQAQEIEVLPSGYVAKASTHMLDPVDGVAFTDVYERDAFLVLRSLFRHSHKETPIGLSVDSLEVRRKILALELIQIVLENYGQIINYHDGFISIIKHILCASILKNGISPLTQVLGLSLSIFLTLIDNLKNKLKNEIGVIFTHVFLPILESSNSTVQQKWIIVSGIRKISEQSQTLVSIFLNYDCDVKATDIYGRMVQNMCKIAHGAFNSLTISSSQERMLRLLALQSLVSMLKSLVDWCHEMEHKGTSTPVVERTLHSNSKTTQDAPASNAANTPEAEHIDPSIFEKQLQTKRLLEQGIAEFNEKPSKGMRFLISQGVLEKDPVSIANFFLKTDNLDKGKLGEYLGEGDQFNINVLYAYVDRLDFTGMTFDEAIRNFLSGFRLPGEAQKIDRMMEKFAERFCSNNPSIFKYADTAYVLAYSIIMLNTDAHNPMVRNKMSKADFVRNSSRIHEDPFLESIYDRIVSNEIKMKDEAVVSPFGTADVISPKKRTILFGMESQKILDVSREQLLRPIFSSTSEYYVGTHINHVKLMFESIWNSILGAFSIIVGKEEDAEMIDSCMDGFKHAINITSVFCLDTERKAFISALCVYVHPSNAFELKEKNLKCIRNLIAIALSFGNSLQTCWENVLRCVSDIEKLKMKVAPSKNESLGILTEGDEAASPASAKLKRANTTFIVDVSMKILPAIISGATSTPSEEEQNAIASEMLGTLDGEIDYIFTRSIRLNDEAIVHFVKKLCEISAADINNPNPRIFCLHKLVEIAEYNMSRIRYVWSGIWSVMAQHFKTVGCNRNKKIAMSSIDALRQLAMKFLEKDELANFHFQKEFLKPFEHIITYNQNTYIRELVVECIRQMALARSKNIKSGWKSVFAVLSIAAGDKDKSVLESSFQVIDHVASNYFEMIADNIDTFVDFVNCLLAFGCNTLFPETSDKALEQAFNTFNRFIKGNEAKFQTEAGNVLFTDSDSHMQIWFPVLTGLSRIVSQHEIAVRKKALVYLFDLLRTHGSSFSSRLWELIYRGVISPIFDDIRYPSRKEESDWIQTTCVDAITALGNLVCESFKSLSFLLPEVFSILSICIVQDSIEVLEKVSVSVVFDIVKSCATQFSVEVWTLVCDIISKCFSSTMPNELLQFQFESPATSSPANEGTAGSKEPQNTPHGPALTHTTIAPLFNQIRSKCITQLQLIQITTDICIDHFEIIPDTELLKLASALETSYKFAATFNKDLPRRIALQRAGFMNQLPNLLKQETNGIRNWLRIFFRMYGDVDASTEQRIKTAEPLLIERCKAIFEEMNERDRGHSSVTPEQQRESMVWSSVVIYTMREFNNFPEENFCKHLPVFYPLLTEMITTNNAEIRNVLKLILVRVGESFVHPTSLSSTTEGESTSA